MTRGVVGILKKRQTGSGGASCAGDHRNALRVLECAREACEAPLFSANHQDNLNEIWKGMKVWHPGSGPGSGVLFISRALPEVFALLRRDCSGDYLLATLQVALMQKRYSILLENASVRLCRRYAEE
jgi:hypothetical protein